jgi:two-component system, NarL family, response regulator NreC
MKPNTKQLRVILVEDHLVVRKGIRSLLEKQPELAIAGEAGNSEEALQLLEEESTAADMLITDVNLPGASGIELLARVKEQYPGIKLVVLSMLDNEKFVAKAFNAGASAYLLKSISPEEMLFALQHVRQGSEYVCSEITMRLLRRLFRAPDLSFNNEPVDMQLSERDTEVLSLIAEGYTNQEIADQLFVGKRTIEGYRQSLMNRTGSRNTSNKYAVKTYLPQAFARINHMRCKTAILFLGRANNKCTPNDSRAARSRLRRRRCTGQFFFFEQ